MFFAVATDFFMGDLSCDSERVSMEDRDIASDSKDDTVLLEEALPPAGQTLCSCGELYHSQDGTREQCMYGDSIETEVDISVSPSSGVKRGNGGDGSSRVSSVCSEPKESSTNEHPLLLPQQGHRRPGYRARGLAVVAAAVLVLLVLAASGPLRPRLLGPPPELVELTLLAGATEKGAVCLDGTLPGYHQQRGSGSGSTSWLIHLEGGGWCSTLKDCSNRRMSALGSSNFMKPIEFAGAGILSTDQQMNPDFYNWNKVYVRYCDGASFSGDTEGLAQDGSTLHFKGLHIYEAVIDELMRKGLANATQALLTGCSAGSLATILHCDDFSARFPQEVSVKCLADAGFFLDVKDISGERSFWSVYDGVVHLQNVRKVLPKDCLANKEPTECFFPAELIKSIHTPMFILNSAYDSWQVRNVLVPGSSAPDKSWLSCKDSIKNCNSTQIQFLDGFRNTMVNDLKVVEDKEDWGMFIDSCFTHCQTLFGISWNSPISPRVGRKNIAEAVGDWHSGKSQGVKEIDCEYPCNPTCSSLLPP